MHLHHNQDSKNESTLNTFMYLFFTLFCIYSASRDRIQKHFASMAGEDIPLSEIPDGAKKEEERQRLNIFLRLNLTHTARSL